MENKSNTGAKKSWFVISCRVLWLLLLAFFIMVAIAAVIGTVDGSGKEDKESLLLLWAFASVCFLILVITRLIFSPRLRRPTFFGLVCLATVVGLFYAEEDWRGKHDWNQFQRGWAAKGEMLEWLLLLPPPVPDDQNFAFAPVVYSSYGQMLDQRGHEKHPRDTNIISQLDFSLGDYTDNTGTWTLGARVDLAAWQKHFRKLAAITNLFQLPANPPAPADDVLLALQAFDRQLEDLRQASQLPESRFPVEYEKEDPAAILLPHLAVMKRCDFVLNLRAVVELQKDQSAAALSDVRLGFRLIAAIRNEPILISHLVRIAMLRLTLQPVWEGLSDHRWSDEQLAALDAELATLDFVSDYNLGMHAELGFQERIADHLRRYPEALDNYSDDQFHPGNVVCFLTCVAPNGWLYQNRIYAAKIMLDHYIPAADVSRSTISPSAIATANGVVTKDLVGFAPFKELERLMIPGLGNCGEKFAFAQASKDMARVAIALERYRLAHGNYPASLDALTPKYLERIPNDVIGGQPLNYRLDANGRFTLYSIGWNERDDGGVTVASANQKSLDLKQGDWVWRYPAP
jgi:hypothetical protein